MHSKPAILISCDRDVLLGEAVRNLLLAAGYDQVDVAVTVRNALLQLRSGSYDRILIVVSTSLSRARRLASIARRRLPAARILLLASSADVPDLPDAATDYVLTEHLFANLLELI